MSVRNKERKAARYENGLVKASTSFGNRDMFCFKLFFSQNVFSRPGFLLSNFIAPTLQFSGIFRQILPETWIYQLVQNFLKENSLASISLILKSSKVQKFFGVVSFDLGREDNKSVIGCLGQTVWLKWFQKFAFWTYSLPFITLLRSLASDFSSHFQDIFCCIQFSFSLWRTT